MGKRLGNGKVMAPLILSEKDLRILKFLAKTDLANARQVAFALAASGSLTAIRARLSCLAGGADYVPDALLLRVPVPSRTGNPQRAYCLGAGGVDIIAQEQGITVSKRRPSKMRILSVGTIRHALALTALYASLLRWQRGQRALVLKECRLSYELSRRNLPAVPDMFCVVAGEGGTKVRWIEVDGSSQWRLAWARRLNERLRYIRTDAYTAAFGKVRPLVCYVALGQTPEAGQQRAQTLARWALSLCTDLGDSRLARHLRFTGAALETVLTIGLWDKPIWFAPHQPTTPLTLLPSSSH